MRIVKPQALGFMQAMRPETDSDSLVVTGLLGFRLDAPDLFIDDQAIWDAVKGAVRPGDVADLWMPKKCAEVLLWGSAASPKAVSSRVVRLQCGDIRKEAVVHGDRHWEPGPLGWRIGKATPFTAMPLIWERTFGGAGFAACPSGVGVNSMAQLGRKESAPLPNIESANSPVRHPEDVGQPVGFLPQDPLWESRRAQGAFTREWLLERHPAMPEHWDAEIYQLAQPDQRQLQPWLGGEFVRLEGMHPEHERIEATLPCVAMRCLHAIGTSPQLHEVPMTADTVWLFPSLLTGVVIYRAVIPGVGTDARRLGAAMIAAEWRHAPKPLAHYQAVYARRVDPQRNADDALADVELMPERSHSAELAHRASLDAAEREREALRETRNASWRAQAAAAVGGTGAAVPVFAVSTPHALQSGDDPSQGGATAGQTLGSNHIGNTPRVPGMSPMADARRMVAPRSVATEQHREAIEALDAWTAEAKAVNAADAARSLEAVDARAVIDPALLPTTEEAIPPSALSSVDAADTSATEDLAGWADHFQGLIDAVQDSSRPLAVILQQWGMEQLPYDVQGDLDVSTRLARALSDVPDGVEERQAIIQSLTHGLQSMRDQAGKMDALAGSDLMDRLPANLKAMLTADDGVADALEAESLDQLATRPDLFAQELLQANPDLAPEALEALDQWQGANASPLQEMLSASAPDLGGLQMSPAMLTPSSLFGLTRRLAGNDTAPSALADSIEETMRRNGLDGAITKLPPVDPELLGGLGSLDGMLEEATSSMSWAAGDDVSDAAAAAMLERLGQGEQLSISDLMELLKTPSLSAAPGPQPNAALAAEAMSTGLPGAEGASESSLMRAPGTPHGPNASDGLDPLHELGHEPGHLMASPPFDPQGAPSDDALEQALSQREGLETLADMGSPESAGAGPSGAAAAAALVGASAGGLGAAARRSAQALGDALPAARRRARVKPLIPPEGDPQRAADLGASAARRHQRGESLKDADLAGADLRGAQLQGVDLRGAFLEGADLTGADLSGAQLDQAVLVGACAQDANFSGCTGEYINVSGIKAARSCWDDARLFGAVMVAGDFTGASMRRACLDRSEATDADLTGARLEGSQCADANWSGVCLNDASIQRAVWCRVNLGGLRWDRCKADGATLTHCILADSRGEDVELSDACLERSNLMGAEMPRLLASGLRAAESSWHEGLLEEAVFDGAFLTGAIFEAAKLRDASFRDANLKEATLSGAQFRGACFLNAQLFGAALRAVDARSADFRGANLHAADFEGAELERADLSHTNLTATLLAKATA